MSQKFHGISLANNSTADNFHFERSANDPVVIKPGRVWFNETQKAFKFSSLDTNGDITINVFSDASSLLASITTLQSDLTAEQTARLAAELALTTSLNTLNDDLVTEEAARIAADTALQTAIDAVAAAATGDGGAALKATLNSGRYTFTSPTAELEHVIVHNLNTAYYLSDVKVEGVDLIYRNDICPIEEIDLNSFRITLTEAAKVKVGVMSLAPIN